MLQASGRAKLRGQPQLPFAGQADINRRRFREIFESRRLTMIAARQRPSDKPLPDPEQFLARNLLHPTLKEMAYVPITLEARWGDTQGMRSVHHALSPVGPYSLARAS
jgi:hypothetical protein